MFNLTLTPRQAAQMVKMRLDSADASPSLILGPPGVGKSAIVKEAAHAWASKRYGGITPPGSTTLIDIRAGDYDAVDFTGVPFVDVLANGAAILRVTKYAQPIMLPTEAIHGGHGVLFLDELTGAALPVQQVLYRLLLDRELNQYRLPDGWRVVGAGNRKEDKAAAQAMSTAMANRCAIFEVDVSSKEWIDWAVYAELFPAIIAYVHAFPQSLHVFDACAKDPRFPSPRSWHKLSVDLDSAERQKIKMIGKLTGEDAHIRQTLVASHLGDAMSGPVVSQLSTYGAIPTLSQLWSDPVGLILPSDQSLVVLLSMMAARSVSQETADACARFLNRRDVAPDIASMALLRIQRRARTDPEAAAVVSSRYVATLINSRNLAA